MNRNDFRNPLIQSGIVLLVVFFLISIVANSPADGFIGSTFSLLAGLVKGILFLVALAVALVVSIAILLGIFIIAVSFHSVDKAKSMFEQLKSSLTALYCKVIPSREPDTTEQTVSADSAPSISTQISPQTPVAHEDSEQPVRQQAVELSNIEDRITQVELAVADIQGTVQTLQQQSASIADEIASMKENDLDEKLAEIQQSTGSLATKFEEHTDLIGSASAKLTKIDAAIQEKLKGLNADVEKLKEKTSVPEVISGILSYIDLPEDREEVAKKTDEIVSRGMTYAQADEYYKKSLAPKVYKVLKAHPRLTKDFIRSVKKKFA